jgi:hypothetical protein
MAKNTQPKNVTRTQNEEDLIILLGDDLFRGLRYGLPETSSSSSSSEGESNYSQAVMLSLAQAHTDYNLLIAEYKRKAIEWKKGAREHIAPWLDEIAQWSSGLTREHSLQYGNGTVNIPSAKEAIAATAVEWTDRLTSLSNSQIRGVPANGNKPAKKAMFYEAKRSASIRGLTISNSEEVEGEADVNFIVRDTKGTLKALFLEVCEMADLMDRNERVKAAKIFIRLTDLSKDSRFGLSRDCVRALLQARTLGKMVAAATQKAKEASEQKEAFLRKIAQEAADESRLKDLRRILQNQKDSQETKTPRPTLPQPIQPMNGITYEDKARRRITRIIGKVRETVEQEFDPITDEDIDKVMALLVTNVDFSTLDELTFARYFSEDLVEQAVESTLAQSVTQQ